MLNSPLEVLDRHLTGRPETGLRVKQIRFEQMPAAIVHQRDWSQAIMGTKTLEDS